MGKKPKNVHEECDKQIDRLTTENEALKKTNADLRESSKRVKTACTTTVAEYKTKFDELKAAADSADEARKVAEANHTAAEKDFRQQIEKLNADHGKQFQQLREEREKAKHEAVISRTAEENMAEQLTAAKAQITAHEQVIAELEEQVHALQEEEQEGPLIGEADADAASS